MKTISEEKADVDVVDVVDQEDKLVDYKTDIFEDDEYYVIKTEMPGVEPNSIKVELDNEIDMVVISGIILSHTYSPSTKFHIRQRQVGRFKRSFIVGGTNILKTDGKDKVDFRNMEYEYENGVIEIKAKKLP